MKISSILGRWFERSPAAPEDEPCDVLDHPELKHLSPRELADLPLPGLRCARARGCADKAAPARGGKWPN